MEVTNVSPSPTSPTEGDDLYEIDVTNIAIHSVTLLIGLCGLAGNGPVLWLLSLKEYNEEIFRLSVTDFFFLLFTVPFSLLFLLEEVSCSPIMPLLYLSFLLQLSLVSYYWALYRLMPANIADYIDKFLQLCWHRELPLRLWLVADSIEYWAFFALFTIIPSVRFLCPSHEQEHCRTALISMYAIILLLFVAPISSSVDFIKAKWGSQQQQPKSRDIVTFIIVLFTFILSICNFLLQLNYIVLPTQVFFLLICIHSTIKPFIYFLAGAGAPASWSPSGSPSRACLRSQNEKTAHSKDINTDTVV